MVLVQVGQQTMSLVDTLLSGRLGTVALAATGLGGTVFFVVAILGMGVMLGVDPLASQAYGANRPRLARRALWQGIHAGLLLTLPLSAVLAGAILNLERFGIVPAVAAEARAYVWGRLPGLFPFLVIVTVRCYFQAARLIGPILWSTLAANIVNFGADWVLMFGDAGLAPIGLGGLGLPALGVAGIGIATSLATLVQLAILALALRRMDPGAGEESFRRPDPAMIRKVFAVGGPISLQILAEAGLFSFVGILAGTFSAQDLASHQIAIMLASYTFMVPLGVGSATSVEVGRAVGRGDLPGVKRAGWAGLALGSGFMIAAATIMWMFPSALAGLFSSDPQVIGSACALIRVAAAFQIFDGVQAVATGALRGTGMTRWAFVANLVAYWGVAMPVGLLMAYAAGMRVVGLWWGLTGGLLVAAAVLTAKFLSASRRPIASLVR